MVNPYVLTLVSALKTWTPDDLKTVIYSILLQLPPAERVKAIEALRGAIADAQADV